MLRTATILAAAATGAAAGSRYISETGQSAIDQLIDFELAPEQEGFVWNRLAYVTDTFGPRFSGTETLERVIDHLRDELIADGLEVTEEPALIPQWVRGDEHVKLLQPREADLPMIGLGMSNNTGGAPVRAPVLVVKDYDELDARADEVAGKIVLYNNDWVDYGTSVQFRSSGAMRAAEYGAVGALIRTVGPYSLQTPHTGTSATAPIAAAAITVEDALMMQRMQDRGQAVEAELYMEATQHEDVWSRNLVVTIPGAELPDEYVVIGGHMDSWDNAPGFIDDGGGFASSFEACRAMHVLGLRPKRTVKCVGFVNEENGSRGAKQFFQDHLEMMNRTSMAIETDAGTSGPLRLGVNGVEGGTSNETYAILKEMGPYVSGRLNASEVVDRGSGVDIGPMCDYGVPCGSLEVRDPREAPVFPYGACAGLYDGDVAAEYAPDEEIPDGYFLFHHSAADTPESVLPEDLQKSAAFMAAWSYAVADMESLLPR